MELLPGMFIDLGSGTARSTRQDFWTHCQQQQPHTMAELARVKAVVKNWEREFRRDHGRAPTKEDIKADTGDIGASQLASSHGY